MLDQTFSLTFIKPEPYRRLQVFCMDQSTGLLTMLKEPVRYSHQLGRFLKSWSGDVLSDWVIGWRDWGAQFKIRKADKQATTPLDHGLAELLPKHLHYNNLFDEQTSNPFREQLADLLEQHGFNSTLPKHRPRRQLPPIPVRAGPPVNTYHRFRPEPTAIATISIRDSIRRKA